MLDNDLIDYLQYKKYGVASLLGPWVEYLAQFFVESLETRRQQLPLKARVADKTQLYWFEATNHDNFDYADQQVREVFNQCLELTSKLHDSMRILKLREGWDKSDDNLVLNNRLTKQGLVAYWKAMDASFQFNVKKHEEFITRAKFRALKTSSHHAKRHVTEDFQDSRQPMFREQIKTSFLEDRKEDEILDFFKRHRRDKYHWSRSTVANRFILPRPKSKAASDKFTL